MYNSAHGSSLSDHHAKLLGLPILVLTLLGIKLAQLPVQTGRGIVGGAITSA